MSKVPMYRDPGDRLNAYANESGIRGEGIALRGSLSDEWRLQRSSTSGRHQPAERQVQQPKTRKNHHFPLSRAYSGARA
jgi:hypothetical protein